MTGVWWILAWLLVGVVSVFVAWYLFCDGDGDDDGTIVASLVLSGFCAPFIILWVWLSNLKLPRSPRF